MHLRIAIVGCGGMGLAHAKFFTQAGASVVAAMDNSEAARIRFGEKTGIQTFSKLGTMIDDARPQAIVVCTPPNERLTIVAECLSRDLPILCEKPLAHTLADAETLLQMARSAKVMCAVGFTHRCVPAIQIMKRRIAAGDIGPLISFRNCFGGFAPSMAQHWGSDPHISGGGIVMDSGPHSVDLFAYLCGTIDVAHVTAYLRHSWPGRGEVSGFLTLRSKKGVVGHIDLSWLFPYPKVEVEVTGEAGGLYVNYERPLELKTRSRDGDWTTLKVENANHRFLLQAKAFLSALEGKHTELADFEDGAIVAKVIDAVYHQSKQ